MYQDARRWSSNAASRRVAKETLIIPPTNASVRPCYSLLSVAVNLLVIRSKTEQLSPLGKVVLLIPRRCC